MPPSSSETHSPAGPQTSSGARLLTNFNFFDKFPPEIILMISSLLEPRDLNAILRASRFFANLLDPSLYDIALTYQPYENRKWRRITVLEWASIHGQPSTLKKLWEKGAGISMTDSDRCNLLQNAVQFGHTTVAQMLLDAGIDPTLPTSNGGTVLHLTADRADEKMARTIFAAGCDPNVLDDEGMTPLHCASRRGHAGIAQTLLDAGADVSAIHKSSGQTPLHYAAELGCDSLVEVLIKAGGDANAADDDGKTPLCSAVESGNFAFVKTLVQLNVDFDVKDGVSGSALHLAIRKEEKDIIEFLLTSGADPFQRDGYGLSCIDRATTREGIFELMKPYCRRPYEPADENITSKAVGNTIVNLARSLQGRSPYMHDTYLIKLAKCLLFAKDDSEAHTAIALNTADMFNGRYVCELCKTGTRYTCDFCFKSTDEDVAMCRQCPEIDVCCPCYGTEGGPLDVEPCQDHEFVLFGFPDLEVTSSLFEEDDVVNERGESREQWLMRLVDTYSADSSVWKNGE